MTVKDNSMGGLELAWAYQRTFVFCIGDSGRSMETQPLQSRIHWEKPQTPDTELYRMFDFCFALIWMKLCLILPFWTNRAYNLFWNLHEPTVQRFWISKKNIDFQIIGIFKKMMGLLRFGLCFILWLTWDLWNKKQKKVCRA